jgi:ferric-dicitrate binding protein FerR (iron transport regulator)
MENDNRHIDPTGLLPKIFAGEATPEEQRLVEEWIAAEPANRKTFETFSRLWSITGITSPDAIDLDEEWKKLETSVGLAPKKTISLVRIIQLAAAVILISTLAFLGLRYTGRTAEKSSSATLSQINLPDGTTVWLNAGSKIIYNKKFGARHRHLTLQGEAFFDVVKDEKLPLIIAAGEARIQVTGTSFNVKAYKHRDEIDVMVTEGSVKLYASDHPLQGADLLAGESGLFQRADGQISRKAVMNPNEIAWKTGIMEFGRTPLSQVAEVLANTYHTKITLDPVIKNCSVTVRFENQTLEAVLDVLTSTLDLEITMKPNQIHIRGKGC